MATYAVGDIQGCFATLQALLTKLAFDPATDRLWLVGDVVNRGPRSREVLTWLFAHREQVTMVLGNHDIHLLACAGDVARPGPRDTIGPILNDPDCAAALDWLRQQPLAHFADGHLLIHAGLLPTWTLATTLARAKACAALLRGPRWRDLVVRKRAAPGTTDAAAHPALDAARATLAVLTRLRMLSSDGEPAWSYKGAPEQAPAGLTPWFEARPVDAPPVRILFGHWAALGCRIAPPWIALDSGCVWGRTLTAYRLEDGAVIDQANVDS